MPPEAAIYILVYVLVIVAIAWIADYIAGQMGAPRPVKLVIWGIALLLVLLVLLRQVGMVHGAEFAVLVA